MKNVTQPNIRNKSAYVLMPDGIKIAIDIWLPVTASQNNRVPTVVEFTRYWRVADGKDPRDRVLYFPKLGFASAVVDCRGSGASFGTRKAELSVKEINDFAHVVNWLAKQPWSNGAIASIGSSYSGNTAEFAMVDAPAALKASIPRFSDFDAYTSLSFPGGLLNKGFLKPWGEGVSALDRNSTDSLPCAWEDYRGLSVKPVAEDKSGVLLRRAIADHVENTPIHEYLAPVEYRDEFIMAHGSERTKNLLSPHLVQNNPRLKEIPSYHWASFSDAGTAAGASARFMGSNAPMRVVIGYWSHGALLDTNPYHPMGREAKPGFESQFYHIARYLSALKSPESELAARLQERALYYYTAGEESWKKTDVWPPHGVQSERWYLSGDNSLSQDKPLNRKARDLYRVDFEAGTGSYTRWDQMLGDVYYGNRFEADKRLLTYTSKPLKQAIEITGHPVISLYVSSTRTDGAIIVYFEEVAPDGSVTMLTEGGLRLIHRKVSSEPPTYPVFGDYHTFEKKDAAPMPVGKIVEVGFGLLPLSVRVKKGHALRVAIAGHDKDCFDRVPAMGAVMYEFHRSVEMASHIEIPMKTIDVTSSNDNAVDPFY